MFSELSGRSDLVSWVLFDLKKYDFFEQIVGVFLNKHWEKMIWVYVFYRHYIPSLMFMHMIR